MFEINCPSCGTPVRFRRESSVYATCESCRSVLMRNNVNLELLGRAADLQPDNTPIQVGTHGNYKGKAFDVLGRIQVHQEDGFWNEWYIGFSDGTDGWMGEAQGEYFINTTYKLQENENIPEFNGLHIGKKLKIAGLDFTVSNKSRSVVCSYEGELPFIMEGAYSSPNADLRSYDNMGCTIDYADGHPVVYIGRYANFADITFSNLRDLEEHIAQRTAQGTTSLKCPCCGAPHELGANSVLTQTLVCEYCGSGLDISNSQQCSVLWQSHQRLNEIKLSIDLNSHGKLDGVDWEVIGYQRKYSKYMAERFYWEEYLCYNPYHGYRYLCYSQGHWSWSQTLHGIPSNKGRYNKCTPYEARVLDQEVNGLRFKHFEGYVGYVDVVLGEFPYKVDLQSQTHIEDYVCPKQGYGLSMERSERGESSEVYWSIAKYLTLDEVRQAFKLNQGDYKPEKIGPFQPNRNRELAIYTTMVALVTLALATVFIIWRAGQTVELTRETHKLCTNSEPSVLTQPFKVTGSSGTHALDVKMATDLDNRWMYIDYALVNTETNEAILASKEISYYHGSSGGEYWSEGSQKGTATIHKVRPGTYVLRIDPQTGTGDKPEKIEPPPPGKRLRSDTLINYSVVIEQDPVSSVWFVLFVCALGVIPVWYMYRWYSSEVDRWEDSEHPKISGSDDDDDE